MQTKYLMNPATGSVDTEENWLAEMPSWEGDQQAQLDALAEMAPITKDDEPGIQEWLNCCEVSVDSEGDVWVEGPMVGHWLDDEKKAKYLEWRGR